MNAPWLSIVGIGEDGIAGLSSAARALVDDAEILVGAERHFFRMPDAPEGQERIVWTSPLLETTERVLAMRGRRVTVLATGDPMHYGIGATIARRVEPDEVIVVPHVSSFALAAARLLWPLDRVTLVSVHGRPVERALPHIAPDARLLILANDGHTPRTIAAMLCARGFGESRMTALAHLGGDKESRTTALAREWSSQVPDLHVLAVECVAAPDAVWHPRVAGLPDDTFRHDGKMTKREARALAIAKLKPARGARLWDIGAGAGSVAIEWLRAAEGSEAIAIEPDASRRAFAAENASALGVPHLSIVDGHAPDCLSGMDVPDAVFIGGGVTMHTISAALSALRPGGTIVAHAVTLESEAVLLDAYRRHGGELVRISIARADPIGDFTGWRPAMPVTQWSLRKTSAIHPGAPA